MLTMSLRPVHAVPQRINVARLQKLAVDINDQCPPGSERVLIGDLMSAIEGASAPSVAPIRTVTKVLKLTIGDMDEFPGQSIAFDVELQKATQKASGKSMGRMRKDAWNKTLEQARTQVAGQKRRRGQDSDDEAEEDDEVGYTQEPGNLVTQKLWYYTPSHDKEAGKKQPSKPGEEDADEDEDEEAESGQNSEAKRKLETDQNVSRAYKYGADLLPISKEEEEEFLQFPAGEPGLQVRGFVKASEVSNLGGEEAQIGYAVTDTMDVQYHPEWALNDPYWVFGGTENRSQLLFSGLLHALQDSKMLALVRMLQPKSVQPRVALLMPLLGDASPSPGLECGLLIQVKRRSGCRTSGVLAQAAELVLTLRAGPIDVITTDAIQRGDCELELPLLGSHPHNVRQGSDGASSSPKEESTGSNGQLCGLHDASSLRKRG